MKRRDSVPALLVLLLSLVLPIRAAASETLVSAYIIDRAELLAEEDRTALSSMAASASEEYACGIYTLIVQDFREYGYDDVFDFAAAVYRESGLGLGTGLDGELLVLSMADRNFALVYHGYGDRAFTEYGRDMVEDAFRDDFRTNSWYSGLVDYVAVSSYLLGEARAGTPVDTPSPDDSAAAPAPVRRAGPGTATAFTLIVAVPCLIAWLVCLSLKSRMTSVRRASTAAGYTVPGTFRLYLSEDKFTHTTRERVRIERRKESDRGGRENSDERHSDGEYSGRSGRF